MSSVPVISQASEKPLCRDLSQKDLEQLKDLGFPVGTQKRAGAQEEPVIQQEEEQVPSEDDPSGDRKREMETEKVWTSGVLRCTVFKNQVVRK